MEINFQFDQTNTGVSGNDLTIEQGTQILNGLNLSYNDGAFSLVTPEGFYTLTFVATYGENGAATGAVEQSFFNQDYGTPDLDDYVCTSPETSVSIPTNNGAIPDDTDYVSVEVSIVFLNQDFEVSVALGSLTYIINNEEEDEEEEARIPEYIYPRGVVPISALSVVPIGFKNHQDQEDYTHISMIVAEIQEDGTVGGDGHSWESAFYDKSIDYTTMLDGIRSMCEGRELTNFNVTYNFLLLDDSGNYNFVSAHVVGGASDVITFSVADTTVTPTIETGSDYTQQTLLAYCLDPVILTISRLHNLETQYVRIEVSNYVADFEFFPDRNILEIDIAEFLQTLWANIDVFEYQQMQTTVVVKLYDVDWNELEVQGITVTSIYGKKPDPTLPECQLRVQWLDKYGYLHDEYFKIVENVTEGESKQKYVSNREDREDKNGEKSITLAYVGANSDQKEQLKTIVFADHIRAYIGDAWKRVKVANTYKTGKGRVTANFEFIIKYAL